MIVTCNVIEDLLPLYADGICSDDSRTVVEHHIAECGDCKKKLEAMTAELEKAAVPPPAKDNPFRKVSRHYAKLIIITLCICAALLIPSAMLFRLYVNGETGQGKTFSDLKLESELRSIGGMFRRGEYRKALNSIDLYCQDDYTPEELAVIKDTLADSLKAYFEKYPIKKIRVSSENKGSRNGIMLIYLKGDFGAGNDAAVRLVFNDEEAEDGSRRLRYSEGWGFVFQKLTGQISDHPDVSDSFPPIELIPKDSAESLMKKMGEKRRLGTFFLGFRTDEILSLERSGERGRNGEYKYNETCFVYLQKLRRLLDDYEYVGCKGGKITYEQGRILAADGCFVQHAVLTMKDKNGGEFTAEFDMPIVKVMYTKVFTHLRNVTYSADAPEDFKARFGDIFANMAEVYSQFEPPKLNEGKFYLNGNTESCYFEVKGRTIQAFVTTEEQYRELYDEICKTNDNIRENWPFEDWYSSMNGGRSPAEPCKYDILINISGASVAYNIHYDNEGQISGYASIEYIDENTISSEGTYIRVE